MRILYHHRTQASDGQAVHIVALQEAFRRAGHEVREVALVSHADANQGDAQRTPTWKRLAWALAARAPRFASELMEYAYNLLAGRALRRAIRSFEPDFIYERYALGNWAGVRAARRTGTPLILEVNSPMVLEMKATRGIVFERLARRIERKILIGADRIAAVTAVLGAILIDLGADSERLIITPNGVDPRRGATADEGLARRGNWGIGAGELVYGFVGFYRDWHRLDRVVRALGRVPAGHLVAVGAGPVQASIEALAAECGLAERVHFPGPVGAAEIPAIVSAFDVGLIPAINEYASPLKLFDYLAGGIAVLAPDQANLREVLEHERTALLFNPRDEADFERQFLRLAADGALRERLGAAGGELIEQRGYTWDANAARIIAAMRPSLKGALAGEER